MDDEVLFITEGLKESSTTVLESALHSLRLFSSEAQREQMLEVLCHALLSKFRCQLHSACLYSSCSCCIWSPNASLCMQAGVYSDLLTSVAEVNSTGSLTGDTATLTTLLGAHMFMLHCNLLSSKGNSGCKAALQHVSMGKLCKLLASMMSRRAYLSVKPKKAHATELKKTKDCCKAWALLPPVRIVSCLVYMGSLATTTGLCARACRSCMSLRATYFKICVSEAALRSARNSQSSGVKGFENSPQALLLVATRCMLDAAALCEHAKAEAVSSGLLNQLRNVACENLAVLTGRRAGNFTDRTNSCMWCALASFACL